MHKEEAQWIADKFVNLAVEQISPLLNLGSSTEDYRCIHQPFINELIFSPLISKGVRVTHLDIKEEPGVDVVGDLLDEEFKLELQSYQFRTILCCNLLEHVTDRESVVTSLLNIVADRGFIIVTVPMLYPKHMDPIDTMYRPSPDELADLFVGTKMIEGNVIAVGKVWTSLWKDKLGFCRLLCRALVPFYKHQGWITAINKLGWLFRERKIACVILKKE